MTTVLVVDDQVLIRQAVVDILSSHPDIEVVGDASDGAEGVTKAAALRPDVVLMDIRMPVLDGIGATEQICADPGADAGADAGADTGNGGTHVLILTTFEEDEYVVAALRAGASGFIGKGAEPEEIVDAVLAVDAGESLLSPAATKSLITRYVATPEVAVGHEVSADVAEKLGWLTERELEVLVEVGRGKSNQEIAEAFFISPHTAKTHVNRIMSKVNAHDRAQLVILAYEGGLLVPGE
ncbi:MAG TPA: response regulator transcription factor [Candidatus Corynebacterium faecigallinarum]|uniref:Response regulator transcription factor n=1 Tax=Candidatus Corynebacterium faecigallinarum TaxID=2838528 RepID=A0A9D2QC42_9CORY|nr:response regulator transcription factor [Candidatus Corynebacterium faecigallinarum]